MYAENVQNITNIILFSLNTKIIKYKNLANVIVT